MSKLTRCNRCRLDDIYRRYGTERVALQTADGWVEVRVDGVRVASFLALTEECAC